MNSHDGLKRILKLMTQEEKDKFKKEFKLPADASNSEIIEKIQKLPRYETIRAFMNAGSSTLSLLQEIINILMSFNASIRTTGCVFILANPKNPEQKTELAFSQQTIGMVCDLSTQTNWKRASGTLSNLQQTWKKFKPVWKQLITKAKPTRKKSHRIDAIKTLIRNQMTFHDRIVVDEDAQYVLKHFFQTVENIEKKILDIPVPQRPEELAWMLTDINELKREADKCFKSTRSRGAKRLVKLKIERYVSRSFVQNFDKFTEDFYLLHDLINGESIIDLLQIDIWSNRPQLFEVWVLLKILNWLENRGYKVELQKSTNQSTEAFRWNLSYAKDSQPCAKVFDISQGLEQFIFYQLYRPSGDMPDISLLETSDPSSDAIWSVDPKHSEMGSYSYANYQKTAIRYKDSFGAKSSIVVEYFLRTDLGSSNPIVFKDGAKLISDCKPFGTGISILFKELAAFHPLIAQRLVCIDFSSSFRTTREDVLNNLRQDFQSNKLTNISSDCICFAGESIVVDNFDKWLNSTELFGNRGYDLSDGTDSTPLITSISEYVKTKPIMEILLVSDGDFNIPFEDFSLLVKERFGIPIKLVTS